MDDLYLALYHVRAAEPMRAADFFAMSAEERAGVPGFENIGLAVLAEDREALAYRRSFGPLRALVPQLEPARQRLLAGEPTLIRSGVDDTPDGWYLLFEPEANDRVRVALLCAVGPQSRWFPVGEHARAIYDFVAAQREALIAAGRRPFELALSLSKPALEAALSREAGVGAELLRLIGENPTAF
jgi:hypothetical protein